MPDADAVYLGRYQQGQELPLVLRCTAADGTPGDPLDVPVATVYRDAQPPVRVQTVSLGADLRGVDAGVFRRQHFLGSLYATAGRYLIVYRWVDAGGKARTLCGSFTLLPGGSPDGAVIAMRFVRRPDATYLMYQTDSGRLIRGRNPRV